MFARSARPWLLAPLLVCSAFRAGPARAAVVWTGDFETNDFKQWNEQQGPVATRVTLVGDPVRQGKYAARFEIHPEDLGSSNLNRVELGHHPDSATFESSERYYAWSLRLPKAFVSKKAHQVTYFESAPPPGGPTTGKNIYHQSLQMSVDGDKLSFSTQIPSFVTRWSGPLTIDSWHDFVLHVKWSTDPAVGLVGLWVDGVQVVSTPVQTMYTLDGTAQTAALPNFMHQGIFRGSDAIADVEVLFLDNTREATELRDVLAAAGASGGDGSSGNAGNAGAGAAGSGPTETGGASTGGAGGVSVAAGTNSGGASGAAPSASGATSTAGTHPVNTTPSNACSCSAAGRAAHASFELASGLLAGAWVCRRRRRLLA